VPHHPDRGAVASMAVTVQPLRRWCLFPEPSRDALLEAGVRGPQESGSRPSQKRHGGTTMRFMILALSCVEGKSRLSTKAKVDDRLAHRGRGRQ
jgi:hypothetical protein